MITGVLTAQTLVVSTVSSSVIYSSGSNIFGNQITNVQQFTGSLRVTGSFNSNVSTANITSPFSPGNYPLSLNDGIYNFNFGFYASGIGGNRLSIYRNSSQTYFDNSAGNFYFNNPVYSSVFGGSFTGSLFGTASWAQNFVTSSVSSASFAAFATSASYAQTASFSSDFTVGSTLTIDQTLTDYATIASSIVGSNNLFTRATGSFTSAFFKYTVTNGVNSRSGEVIAVWNGSTTEYTDFSTVDIGNTSAVTASASIVSSQIQFNMQTNTGAWRIKTLATFM